MRLMVWGIVRNGNVCLQVLKQLRIGIMVVKVKNARKTLPLKLEALERLD
jgi:hypothetical protein